MKWNKLLVNSEYLYCVAFIKIICSCCTSLFLLRSICILLSRFPHRAKKKTKPLNLKIHSSVGSCENLPTQRSPLHTERSLRSFFFPSFIPSTPPVHAETPSASKWAPLVLISSHSSCFIKQTTLIHTHISLFKSAALFSF